MKIYVKKRFVGPVKALSTGPTGKRDRALLKQKIKNKNWKRKHKRQNTAVIQTLLKCICVASTFSLQHRISNHK